MSSNIPYASLNVPPSPGPREPSPRESDVTYESIHNIPESPRDQPFDPYNLPAGAAPRFLGNTGGDFRNSLASSTGTLTNSQDYRNSHAEYDSVHGLNFRTGASTPTLAAVAAGGGTGGLASPLLSQHHLPYHDDPNSAAIPLSPMGTQTAFPEKREAYASPKAKTKRKVMIGAVVGAVLLAVAAIAVPVWYFAIRPKSNSSSSSSSTTGGSTDGGSTTTPPATNTRDGAVTGGDGSKIKMENGTEFTYKNSFGGYWYFDPADPFKSAAKAQSYTPALNETWDYNVHKIMGVNLGGWLNTEPFISPALYEKYYPDAVDEWTLSQHLRDDASAGINKLEEHYNTFITEEDFAAIAAAGLNWVRLPIGFWAIEVWDGEPFLERTSWKYLLKAIEWARKYGIRINLDFHAAPGSQNGWNHSGRLGVPNFMNGVMGIANAQRTLDYLRYIVQFISQPQYKDVIPMFGVINEVFSPVIGMEPMDHFYLKMYDELRAITGTGQGNGPVLSMGDGFVGIDPWKGRYPGSDRLALDIHPYFAFSEQSSAPMADQALRACNTWGGGTNRSMGNFGITAAGEFSNAINDCGLYVNGVGIGTRYEGTFPGFTAPAQGDCARWTDWTKYTDQDKADIMQFVLASMDALTHFFFWTWKIGDSAASGRVEAPFWSYKLGLEQGWMPKDPRDSIGKCAALGVAATPAPQLPATATGGGSGTIDAAFRESYTQWPPATLTNIPNASNLPTYTQTGTPVTLPGPTFTKPGSKETFDAGNGWFNAADKDRAYTKISGCSYPDNYSAVSGVAIPTAACTGARKRSEHDLYMRIVPTPAPTAS